MCAVSTERQRRDAAQRELLRRYHVDGDQKARAQLAEDLLPLARALAARYADHLEPQDDLFQVACVGLMKAIDGFDTTREVAFPSYATPTILGEIKRYFRDRTWAVRPPRGMQEHQMLVATARDKLTSELGRSPGVHELAERTHLSDEEVLEAIQATGARHARSIFEPTGDAMTLADTIGGSDPELPRAEARAMLDSAMHVLDERERQILKLRFEDDLTQNAIAEVIGVSQMQVSRLIRQSLGRLRIAIGDDTADALKRLALVF